jgi:hypothetical protein
MLPSGLFDCYVLFLASIPLIFNWLIWFDKELTNNLLVSKGRIALTSVALLAK